MAVTDQIDCEPKQWIDCAYCGGSGVVDGECTCMDDTCCCLEPEPPDCEWCNGEGGWWENSEPTVQDQEP